MPPKVKRAIRAKPLVRYDGRRRAFVASGSIMRGAHKTIEMWYGCTHRTSLQTGDWIDRYNLARGTAISHDLRRWIKAGSPLSGASFTILKTQTRAIIQAIQARSWKIISVETPVVVKHARTATAVDLIVATSPPKDAPKTWKPSQRDPVAVCEIKLVGTRLWDAPSGPFIPASICGGTSIPATPRKVAMIQLALTHVLYSSTFAGQLQSPPVLIHVYPVVRGMVCNMEELRPWVHQFVIPDIRRRLAHNDHQRASSELITSQLPTSSSH